MPGEFEGKRFTTQVMVRNVSNIVTGEKTLYPNVYSVFDTENNCVVNLPNFHPTCYEDIRSKAIELNDENQ